MSDLAVRAALSRMHLNVVALSPEYPTAAFASDMRQMASANQDNEQVAFLKRRADMCAAFGVNDENQRKPFAFAAGLAIIPVTGALINRFHASYGYVTGYNFIRSQLRHALADEDVKGIVFDVNSYGGECAGCMELADEIRESRAVKPSLSVVDSNSYSAGYALGSAASRMVAIPSAGVGSIGVIAMHIDMSEMLKEWGIKVSLIYEAEHKADGNPYEPLPDNVRARFQKQIHASYETFVALVAANRNIDAQRVRDTKSQTYRADEGLSLGLIDAVVSPSEAIQAFLGELSGSTSQMSVSKENTMTTETQQPGSTTTTAPAPVAAAPVAAAPTVDTAAVSASAQTAERARVQGILQHAEADGRTQMAQHLAFNTNMSVEDAGKMLAVAPKSAPAAAAPAPAANAFATAMNNSDHPNVGADTNGNGNGGEMSAAQQIIADARAYGTLPAASK